MKKRPMIWLLWIFGILFGLVVLWFGYALLMGFLEERDYQALQDTHDLPNRVDAAALELVGKRPHARLTIAVYQKGERWVKSYGSFQPTHTTTPDGMLIYEIGSVTKVFTGITLARLVNEGLVKLSDPLSVFVPNLPADLKKITLVQLATHSSGLPRLPDNLEETIKNQQDPYANYTSQDLLQSLTATKLESTPGKSSSYSNLGMGLLGHLLSDKAKQPYAQLVETTVTQPLRMKDTTLTLSPEQEQRLVKGHEADGKPCLNWTFQVLAPTGGLRSAAEDMLLFLEAHLKGTSEPLQSHLRLAMDQHYDSIMDKLGLAWHIAPLHEGLTAHWHNGGTGGYSTFLALSREHQTGVVLMINISEADTGMLDALGMQCLKWATKISLK